MAPNIHQPHRNQILEDAWGLFATNDHNANRTQTRFRWFRGGILLLGIVATTLAILYQVLFPEGQTFRLFGILSLNAIIRFLVILLPISVSALLIISSKFERSVNWILLHGSAEAVRREIFRFRSRTDIYSKGNVQGNSHEKKLARKIKSINECLMKIEVNQSGLQAYPGSLPPPRYLASKQDDGFSYITPSQYIQFRLENQRMWYRKQTTQLNKSIRRLHYQIIFFGVIGTLLAVFEFEIWIALTTAFVGAISSYIEYNQDEQRLTSYNITATDLESIRSLWRSLPEDEKHTQEIYEKLDEETRKSPLEPPFSSLPPERGHDDFPSSPLDWDSLFLEDLPDAPKLSPDLIKEIDKLITLDEKKGIQLSKEMDPNEVPELSSEEIKHLGEIFDADQEEGIHISEEMGIDEVSIETETDEEPPVEDSFLPFGDVDFSDDDLIVDDFVPGKAVDQGSTQAVKQEESKKIWSINFP